MYTRIVLFLIIMSVAVSAGCGGGGSAAGDETVAAFYPLAFATEQVGDGKTRNLTPPGAEPHDFELTPGDVAAVKDAKLVVYLGEGFQPALEEAIADRTGPSLDLLEGERLLVASAHEHHEGEPEAGEEPAGETPLDPHVWLDPVRYGRMASRIAAALGNPDGATAFTAELDALDAEFARGLRACERREIVTSHAAFGYLADRYDLTQVPLTGLSPEAEPSAKDIARLATEVEKEGATTVFFETLVSAKLAETVAREAGAETAVLNPLEGLTSEEENDGADYFSVMRENLAVLREALGCT